MSECPSHVTWKGLIAYTTGLGTVLVAGTSALIGWSWTIHIAQPHPGAITEVEYERHERIHTRDFVELKQQLNHLEQQLDDHLINFHHLDKVGTNGLDNNQTKRWDQSGRFDQGRD